LALSAYKIIFTVVTHLMVSYHLLCGYLPYSNNDSDIALTIAAEVDNYAIFKVKIRLGKVVI